MSTPQDLEKWIQDSSITDICINSNGQAYLDRGLGLEPQYLSPCASDGTSLALKNWVLEQLSKAGISWDARNPFVDAPVYPAHRLHAVFPPVSGKGMSISLRRLGRTLEGPASERWKSSGRFFETLKQAVRTGQTVLIAGSTGSGKTTLLNDLLSFIPEHERLIALEDTPELSPAHPHFVSLQSRAANADGYGEISIQTLLRQCLRMRPDRVLLGECRGAEILDLLQILNTGHRGSLATLHANSVRDALKRMETLALLHAPESLSIQALRDWMSSGIQWIAHVQRDPGGIRRVREVAQVCGIESGTILLRPVD